MASVARTQLRVCFLALALGLSLSARAEERKEAAEHGAAAKSAATTAAKPSAPGITITKPSVVPPKPEIASTVVERAQAKAHAEVVAPEPMRLRPIPAPVARRVAPAPARPAIAKVIESPAPMPVVAPQPHSLHWSYEGPSGPHAWAKLAPEYAKCGSGERQSPIDIRDGMKLDLDPITFEYRPSSFRVLDNGHTIQANVNGWNSMRVMGRRFRLEQFHFHRPSEEMIDGKQFEMVVHLVHKDSESRLAVVAVLVESGARQPVIQAVLNNLPLERGEELAVSANLDLAQMLPANRRYFTYMGSLTTPPCSEDVLWIVMKQPVQATEDQLELISRMYPMNARPIQASSGRTIKESN